MWYEINPGRMAYPTPRHRKVTIYGQLIIELLIIDY